MFVATAVQIEPGAIFVDVRSTLEVFVRPSHTKRKFEPDITTLPGIMIGGTSGVGGST